MIFLCYHGVTRYKSKGIENFSKKHINVKDFYDQMIIIKKKCNILDINSIYHHLSNNISFKKNSVAVSFDDGFENNFSQALPILKKLKIPAIFYICPESIEKKVLFWVDKIEASIINTKKKSISLSSIKKTYSLRSNNEKKRAILKIKNLCKNFPVYKKDNIISDLIKKTKVKISVKFSDNYKIAKWSQIISASKNNLFEIGGHSLEHNIFTKLPENKLKNEISKCKNLIEKKIGKKVRHFSYPEGKYNSNTIKILKELNVLTCPIASGQKNTKKTDVYKIKRIMVGFNNKKFPKF